MQNSKMIAWIMFVWSGLYAILFCTSLDYVEVARLIWAFCYILLWWWLYKASKEPRIYQYWFAILGVCFGVGVVIVAMIALECEDFVLAFLSVILIGYAVICSLVYQLAQILVKITGQILVLWGMMIFLLGGALWIVGELLYFVSDLADWVVYSAIFCFVFSHLLIALGFQNKTKPN